MVFFSLFYWLFYRCITYSSELNSITFVRFDGLCLFYRFFSSKMSACPSAGRVECYRLSLVVKWSLEESRVLQLCAPITGMNLTLFTGTHFIYWLHLFIHWLQLPHFIHWCHLLITGTNITFYSLTFLVYLFIYWLQATTSLYSLVPTLFTDHRYPPQFIHWYALYLLITGTSLYSLVPTLFTDDRYPLCSLITVIYLTLFTGMKGWTFHLYQKDGSLVRPLTFHSFIFISSSFKITSN